MRNRWLFTLAMSFVFVLLAACGGNEPSEGEEPEAGDQEQVEETGDEGAEASGPYSVEDVFGTVEFEDVPERIVVLEWTYAEDLLALGVQPVGMADIEGFEAWVDIEAGLSDEVVDVGTRQEPNLEEIAALEPDLIITAKFRHEAIKDELDLIAPTLFFEPYPEDESINQYDEMVTTFETIAKVVQREDEAATVLAEMEQKFEEAKEAIAEADLESNEFILAMAYSGPQAPAIRIFAPNGMATIILENLGLENVHEPDAFEMYGYSEVNVEALPEYEDANFIYVVQEDDNVFEDQLADNPVWTNLNFVQEERTYSLGGDAWLYGGPLSAKTLVDRLVDSLTQ
ncbi:iron-siderophore ABC transporter substrate-binding protein [Halalkalibacterium halodurans]|uniref:Ferrichrome ABC transporter substrate-binding protein n=1 Tax=Halalkalibacterium halodurans TaxID=86665 RepID=A0A0M0KNA0_ALKHA|nr:iron-siderophore ABC transporter substrate-binding protein [Halalkalibacterium halodurans]MED3647376.1 iron-siderophore ABC transporter substrate-binding protein [Halalkalibacterium halodurans]MED4163513.1 iron-siderophore ABC transporter substrate-binding protein [Halalkalibacterium halodurans]TPE70698.1 iron-siderophore ABC transporter substrate-binding protein [Halalkalibacterium halodurans]